MKYNKIITGLTLTSIFLLSTITGCSKSQPREKNPVNSHGNLSVEGPFLMDQYGEPITLRGYGFFWHQWQEGKHFYNKACVKWLQDDFKVTLIRPWIGAEADSAYIYDKEFAIKQCNTMVKAAIDLGLYVIIDFHSHKAAEHMDMAIEFFTYMAKKWGGHPNVLFETWNEPERHDWDTVIKPYHEKIIQVIRDNDPDDYKNVIILGTSFWSQFVDKAADNPVKGDNLMYTLHYYCDSEWHQQPLLEKAQYAVEKGLPIFVTEFGLTQPSGDGKLNWEWGNRWMDFMETHKISWCPMTIGNKYESMCALTTGNTKYTGDWDPEIDLKESGRYFRNLLREKNADEY